MITKSEFVQYCMDVRKTYDSLLPDQDYEMIYRWIKGNRGKTLLQLFDIVGLWMQYEGEFKYPELAELLFTDLPDESNEPNIDYLDILEQL
jgi:hypothetical protein